jgi:outer membrane PBP1 activator LpoA protein
MPRFASVLVPVALAAVLTACGAAFPPPNDQVATTQGAVRAAEEAGADKDPEAQLYLKLAREQLDKARELMTEGQHERADRLLRRSEADADLARGLARSKGAAAEAEAAKKAIANINSVDK